VWSVIFFVSAVLEHAAANSTNSGPGVSRMSPMPWKLCVASGRPGRDCGRANTCVCSIWGGGKISRSRRKRHTNAHFQFVAPWWHTQHVVPRRCKEIGKCFSTVLVVFIVNFATINSFEFAVSCIKHAFVLLRSFPLNKALTKYLNFLVTNPRHGIRRTTCYFMQRVNLRPQTFLFIRYVL